MSPAPLLPPPPFWKRSEFRGAWITGALLLFVVALSIAFSPGIVAASTVVAAVSVGTITFFSTRAVLEQRQATEKAERGLATLIEGLKEGVVIYDTNFTVVNLNAALERLTGLTSNEVVGKRIEPNFVKNPHYRALAQILFPSLAPSVVQLSETNAWPQTTTITIDEPPLELLTTLFRILDGRGELIGFLKLVHDQTHEQSVLRAKNEFISTAAHQLRTPVTAISWAIEGLAPYQNALPPEGRELIQNISQLAGRVLRLTNDLLDASRIEEGRFGYGFESADIVAFVKKILGESVALARQYGVQVFFESPPKDTYAISFDPARISTVLSNLIDNAIRYNTEHGKVTVSISEIPGKPFVKITVTDTGIGVPQEETARIFKKLERGSNAVRIEPNGTGLGLYISRNIVRRHGGSMGFESIVGRGSSFWFTLPLDSSLIPQKEAATQETL
ncbi:MAG: PAS domain-containing sensor histidine kinase [Patescibacteria group bacterium]